METQEKEEKKTEEKTNVQFAGFRVEDGAEMKACRYCKVMVPKKAWICPNCKMKIRRHWGRLIAVVLVLAVLAGGTAFLLLTERGNAVMASAGVLTETKKKEAKAAEASAEPETKETESTEASAKPESEKAESTEASAKPEKAESTEASAKPESEKAESTEASAKPEKEKAESTEASAKPEPEKAESAETSAKPEKAESTEASAKPETENAEASAGSESADVGILPEFGSELLLAELTGEGSEEAAESETKEKSKKEEESKKEEKSKTEEKQEGKKQQKEEQETDLEETADEDAEKEEEFRSLCEVVDYRMLMRTPEEYVGQKLTVTAEILELVDGGLFDDQIYYLAVSEDEKGILRYYILRDDRGEDALPLFEGDEICIYGQLFDTCVLKGRLEIDREVPAVSILFLDLL